MKLKKILSCVTLVFLSSCSFGVKELKVDFPDKNNFKLIDTNLSKVTINPEKDINVTIEWVGNAYPLSTSKSLIGFTNRFVVPYTKNTSLINLKIENKSDKTIDFSTDNIDLNTLPFTQTLKPLTIDFFKNKWPTFAVKSQDMLIDQSIAIGEVIRTIIRDQIIAPNSSYEGYLAFNRVSEATKELDLNLKIKLDKDYKSLSVKFTKNE